MTQIQLLFDQERVKQARNVIFLKRVIRWQVPLQVILKA